MQLKRFAAILLAILFIFCSLTIAEAEEEEENRLLWQRETPVTPDICVFETVLTNGSRQAEHYICYTPGGCARPVLAYGANIREKLEFPAAAEQTDGRVLAGVNGDYFVMATGMPLGIILHEGELISSDTGNAAFGFLEDGSAILGLPGLRMELSSENASCKIDSINKNYKSGQFCLYTSAWGEQLPLSEDYRCLELIPEEDGIITLGGDLHCFAGPERTPETALSLEKERLYLCYSGPEEAWQLAGLANLEPGTMLTLTVRAADARFEGCWEALGCLYPLLSGGEVLPGLDEIDKNKAPRTAIGIRENGEVILYTADGRQSGYAIGLSLQEAAMRLKELGCVDAGALDGGASTVMACQLPGEEDCTVRNAPSLGRLRETPQFLLLTAPEETPGPLAAVAVTCEEKVLLAGSSSRLYCGGCDDNGAPIALYEIQWSSDCGSVDDSGLFTAPEWACEAVVTARCSSIEGEFRIPVISQPEEIRVVSEENGREIKQLRVLPGSETELCAKAFWNGMEVCASDELFRWQVEGEAGTIDDSGLFTASENAAIGELTVRCGETVCSLQILVTDSVICAEDYENIESGTAPGLSWSQESNRDKVKYGLGSLRLDYDLTEGSVTFSMEDYPTELGSSASLWILSDGSGNNVYSVHDEISILLGKLDHAGWMQFQVNTDVFGRIRALRIGGSGSGTLWLDQLMIFNETEPDTEAPIIHMQAENGRLSAIVWDQAEGVLPASLIHLTANGENLAFEYDDSSGTIQTALPLPDPCIRIVLTAYDRSGNYNSASILMDDGASASFPDMNGHWASRYVDHLRSMGVIAGRLADDGSTYFDPDSKVTRAEFAVMLCRWLRIDTSLYDTILQFADEDSIPSWARSSVKAAAALGLIQGSPAGDGIYFMPQQLLTRSQAAVILGRTMPGGRMLSDLPWPDAEDIPAWARTYVSELAFMGVMTGNGVNFEPNSPLTRAQAAKLFSELS
jgi:hypothetical protein